MAQMAAMAPLDRQFRQGQIDQQGAQLPGIMGQSQSSAAQGQIDSQTMSSKVAASISNMTAQMGDDQVRMMGQDGEKFLQIAQIATQYPPASQKAAATAAYQKMGGNTQNPMFQAVMQAPDAEFGKAIASFGTGMATASRKYIQESSMKNNENASQERIGDKANASHERIAQIAADSRRDAANSRSKAAMSHMNMDQKITYLSSIPESERTPDEHAQLVQLAKQRLAEKAAGANATPASVLGTDTPTVNAGKTAENIFNDNKPAPTNVNTSDQDFKTLAAKMGHKYDEKKYDYRINPETGTLQYALKK